MIFGLEQEGGSLIPAMALAHPSSVKEQVLKPLGWMMFFLVMTFVPVQKLCVK